MDSDDDRLKAVPPPWQVFPHLAPASFAPTQGAEEAWTDGVFRPFWQGLAPDQRERYLDLWGASPDWRTALAVALDTELDREADAQDSERALDDWRQRRKPRSLLDRLLGRNR